VRAYAKSNSPFASLFTPLFAASVSRSVFADARMFASILDTHDCLDESLGNTQQERGEGSPLAEIFATAREKRIRQRLPEPPTQRFY
jgi:uncharacterized protein YdcH (DUF465 family)